MVLFAFYVAQNNWYFSSGDLDLLAVIFNKLRILFYDIGNRNNRCPFTEIDR